MPPDNRPERSRGFKMENCTSFIMLDNADDLAFDTSLQFRVEPSVTGKVIVRKSNNGYRTVCRFSDKKSAWEFIKQEAGKSAFKTLYKQVGRDRVAVWDNPSYSANNEKRRQWLAA